MTEPIKVVAPTGGQFRLEIPGVGATKWLPHDATPEEIDAAVRETELAHRVRKFLWANEGSVARQMSDGSWLLIAPGATNWNATPNEIQEALEKLAGIGTGQCSVQTSDLDPENEQKRNANSLD